MSLETIQEPTAKNFQFWWNVIGESVEEPNVRRDGESGVVRVNDAALGTLYVKRQRNHLYRSFCCPFGEPTVLREKAAITAMNLIGISTPRIAFVEARQESGGWRAILATHNLEGYCDLERWYQQGGRQRLGTEQHARFLRALGRTLGIVHKHRWQHTALYPKHIFVTAGSLDAAPEIALIDLEKARRKLSANRAAQRDLDQLRRHSSMWNDADWALLMEGHQQAKI